MERNILIAIIAGLIGGLIGAGMMVQYQNHKNSGQSEDNVVFKVQVPKGLMDDNKK